MVYFSHFRGQSRFFLRSHVALLGLKRSDLTVGVANRLLPVNKFAYMCQHPVLGHFCLKTPHMNKVKKPLKDPLFRGFLLYLEVT